MTLYDYYGTPVEGSEDLLTQNKNMKAELEALYESDREKDQYASDLESKIETLEEEIRELQANLQVGGDSNLKLQEDNRVIYTDYMEQVKLNSERKDEIQRLNSYINWLRHDREAMFEAVVELRKMVEEKDKQLDRWKKISSEDFEEISTLRRKCHEMEDKINDLTREQN